MKTLFIIMLAFMAINVSYAGYGEDMKGECTKGKDSARAQEVIVEGSSSQEAAAKAKSKTK
jgi:hypothetical protein